MPLPPPPFWLSCCRPRCPFPSGDRSLIAPPERRVRETDLGTLQETELTPA